MKQNSGGRSNSSLSSREVEFQNWKRRKSYDPMKAAAEVKFYLFNYIYSRIVLIRAVPLGYCKG